MATKFPTILSKKEATCSAVLLGFSVPISTSLDGALLIILIISALIGWNKQYLSSIQYNPVSKIALILLGVFFVGCFYGIATPIESLVVLGKYDDLILFVLLLPIFSTSQNRTYGQMAFMIAMALTLIISYLIYLKVLQNFTFPFNFQLKGTPDNPVVFKLHITQGIFMSFAAFMSAVYALNSKGIKRWAYLLLTILATCNVLLMTQGRTGYIVIVALALYLALTVSKRNSILFLLTLAVAFASFTYLPSSSMKSRIELGIHEGQAWRSSSQESHTTSIGQRMDFYKNTLEIIKKNPIIGVGTGGFEKAYATEVLGKNMPIPANPHNQFLLTWVQTGIVGLLTLICLFWIGWRDAKKLPTPTDTLLAHGLLITFCIGCLFNSLLLDHAEGLFFAWFGALLFSGLARSSQISKS